MRESITHLLHNLLIDWFWAGTQIDDCSDSTHAANIGDGFRVCREKGASEVEFELLDVFISGHHDEHIVCFEGHVRPKNRDFGAAG